MYLEFILTAMQHSVISVQCRLVIPVQVVISKFLLLCQGCNARSYIYIYICMYVFIMWHSVWHSSFTFVYKSKYFVIFITAFSLTHKSFIKFAFLVSTSWCPSYLFLLISNSVACSQGHLCDTLKILESSWVPSNMANFCNCMMYVWK